MHTDITPLSRPLFKAAPISTAPVTLQFEDATLTVPAGITVAAALLLAGADHFRTTPVQATVRAPYCMMGVCFECLVSIDGQPSRQACLTIVREGMVVTRQNGASALPVTEDAQHAE